MAKPGQVPEGYTRLTFNLEKTLHKELKKAAVDDERSVTDVLVDLISKYVAQHRPPRRKKD
jgi:hypothetical protein